GRGDIGKAAAADPVDVAQMQPSGRQSIARADDHPPPDGIEVDDVERLADGDADAAALADSVVDDTGVTAKHAAVDMDDVAGFRGARLQPLDHIGVPAVRHKADVLAVVLVGDGEAEA